MVSIICPWELRAIYKNSKYVRSLFDSSSFYKNESSYNFFEVGPKVQNLLINKNSKNHSLLEVPTL